MTPGTCARYALYAVLDLARSSEAEPVSVSMIARRHRIPETVLAKVFQRLVRSGLVYGMRGPHGGYRLARSADKITLLDVLDVFEPASPASEHVSGTVHRDDSLQEFIGTVDGQARSAFGSVTLDRLAAHEGHLF